MNYEIKVTFRLWLISNRHSLQKGGGGDWTKFWRGCAAAERQNPPIFKGDERTRQAPCLRNLSPWRPMCMHPPPPPPPPPPPRTHPHTHTHTLTQILPFPMPSQPLQYFQVVIALLRKYTRCQLPLLSISGYPNRWKYAVWSPVVGMMMKYKTQF